MNSIRKRNGQIVPFEINKIANAIEKAFIATSELNGVNEEAVSKKVAEDVAVILDSMYTDPVYIEDIQDIVERTLMNHCYEVTAKAYILYRAERERTRDKNSRLMKTLDEIAQNDAKDVDIKRENANIDCDTAMGTMLKFGSESSKMYSYTHILPDDQRYGHENGDIHIHDLDFYMLTATCCQLNLTELFRNGFGTGHGYIREPNCIESYSALAAIAMQANQNDMHGGQSIPNFDRDMAPGVAKSFIKSFRMRLSDTYADYADCSDETAAELIEQLLKGLDEKPSLSNTDGFDESIATELSLTCITEPMSIETARKVVRRSRERAIRDTERSTYQAMEGLIHNLNTMHSRAGAQVPFTTLNYGTDTSPEGRMVIKNILNSTIKGLGNGETPIFPIQIFRLKKGINMDDGDINYDLFKLSLKCSAKRMFPNFSFQDASFNLEHYNPNEPRTEIAYMGCRTRVMANAYDPDNAISDSRGNLSFTTINLPRIAFTTYTLDEFFDELNDKLELVYRQLMGRFEILASKRVYNFPFLMGQKLWLGSDKLNYGDTIGEIIKHGTLSIGFIGLAETLILLTGKHHGESKESQELGLKIIKYMRDFCDRRTAETGLNFTLLATPAEGLSGRFIKMDAKKFGDVKGVTDKEYYTNSFHIPVSFDITMCDKIKLEAPYHALTNAGHISYIEIDGDVSHNLEALESIVKYMGECNIGYGAINHPIDRDPVCGYNGIIYNECPKCGRTETDDAPFERIRRITGYLVGSIERFNNAKRAEEKDRVKHRYGR